MRLRYSGPSHESVRDTWRLRGEGQETASRKGAQRRQRPVYEPFLPVVPRVKSRRRRFQMSRGLGGRGETRGARRGSRGSKTLGVLKSKELGVFNPRLPPVELSVFRTDPAARRFPAFASFAQRFGRRRAIVIKIPKPTLDAIELKGPGRGRDFT